MSTGLRILIGVLVAVLASVGWRLFSPYSLPRLAENVGEDLRRLWSQPYFHLGDLAITPSFVVKATVFLILLVLFMRVARRFIRRRILDHTSMDEGQKFSLERGTGYLLFTLGLLAGLQSLGLDMSTLAVVGGALGIGVGFGLQNIANNFASGLILLVERPVKVGDRVEVGELIGDVLHIGSRATKVRTNDNVIMIVPNSEFVQNRVTNWTANDRQVRLSVPFGVAYGSDLQKVVDVTHEVARGNPDVLEWPAPDVVFVGFGDSSLDLELRIWTVKQMRTPKRIASAIYFALFEAFAEHGIEIPFPQRDLHLRSADAPVTVAGPRADASSPAGAGE